MFRNVQFIVYSVPILYVRGVLVIEEKIVSSHSKAAQGGSTVFRARDNKSDGQMICELYDSFVKSALRNKSRTLVRDYLRIAKHEQLVWDIEGFDQEGRTEEYEVDAGYEIVIHNIVCTVYSEQLYQAFLSLDEKVLLVLILQYWEYMPDEEIAAFCHITTRAVRKRRQKAILQLKEHMQRRGDAMLDEAGCEDHL